MSVQLAAQQRALLEALWLNRHEEAEALTQLRGVLAPGANGMRGMRAYRINAQELARRALQSAYPVIAELLGDDNFAALARSFWLRYPPGRGDLAHWGGDLAAHITSLSDLCEEEPYLGDVARTEWLLHLSAFAADARADASSFELLTTQDPAILTLVLTPGVASVCSPHPVVSIIGAHMGSGPTLQDAAARLRAGVPETALIWREGMKPRLRNAAPGEAKFIAALQEKRSLADSLATAPDLDFSLWIEPAARSGLLMGAALL